MEKLQDQEQLIYNYQRYITETNTTILKSKLERILLESEFTIVGFIEKHFKPQGYTCVWVLAESHLAVHTFPEKNTTYIELSSCNGSKNQKFIDLIDHIFMS